MKNFTLYRISRAIMSVLNKIVDALMEGPLDADDPLYQELDDLFATRNRKLQGYVKIIKSCKPLADACRAEAEAFSKRARAIENLARRLRNNLLYDMQVNGEESTQAGRFKISRRNSESVQLHIPPESLPAEFQNVSITADKTALKKALKAGDEIKGVVLKSGEYVEFRIK